MPATRLLYTIDLLVHTIGSPIAKAEKHAGAHARHGRSDIFTIPFAGTGLPETDDLIRPLQAYL